jgi:nicotinamidase-related amidase
MPTVRVSANPWPFEFDPARTALLVIDMQNDFLSPGGNHALRGRDLSFARRAIEPIQRVLATVRSTDMLVFHTREGYRPELVDCPPNKMERSRRLGVEIGGRGPLGRRFVRGEESHDFIPELRPAPGEIVLDKPSKCCFYATDLDAILRYRGITHLVFTGVSTDVCVHTTVRNANDRGFFNLVLEDACGSFDPKAHEAAIYLTAQSGGIFGTIASSDQFVRALQTAGHAAAAV